MMKTGLKFYWDDKETQKSLTLMQKMMKSQTFTILKDSSKAFVNAAIKTTPPYNNGPRKKTTKQLYNRIYITLR